METELSTQMLTKQLSPEVEQELARVREHLVQLGRDELNKLVEGARNGTQTDS